MSRKDTLNSLFFKKPDAAAPAPAAPAPRVNEPRTEPRTQPRNDPGAERSDRAPERPADRPADRPERVRTGAISAMSSSLQEMAEGVKTVARLQEQLAHAEAVVSLDPASIDGSGIADRLPVAHDPGFEALVASIAETGQQVPVLVRPSPVTAGRFQIAYGRRRLAAAARLGLPVKAIVRRLTDAELVVAQGRENLDRADLSFIEKALFARRLEDAGHERATIVAALSTDKGDLSRYIAVARAIPERLVEAIGPARKAGRARWLALAEGLERPGAALAVEAAIAAEAFQTADSDARFALVLAAIAAAAKPKRAAGRPRAWTTPQGRKAARIEVSDGRTALVFDDKAVPAFASFVADRLDRLYDEFTRERGGETRS